MSRRAQIAFAAISVIWGLPYLLIKIAFGVVEIAIPLPLIAFGEQRASSSLAAILIATVPLIIALISIVFDTGEAPTRIRMVGLCVGFAGVVTLLGVDVGGDPRELVGVLAILAAAFGYALGPMIVKHRLAAADPRATMGASMVVASLLLAPLAALIAPHAAPEGGAFAAVVALGLVCTALAFVVYNILITEAGPGPASVVTYINPVIAVALGVSFLGEQPGAGAVAGLLLILAGSWLSTGGRLPPRVLARARRHDAAEQTFRARPGGDRLVARLPAGDPTA